MCLCLIAIASVISTASGITLFFQIENGDPTSLDVENDASVAEVYQKALDNGVINEGSSLLFAGKRLRRRDETLIADLGIGPEAQLSVQGDSVPILHFTTTQWCLYVPHKITASSKDIIHRFFPDSDLDLRIAPGTHDEFGAIKARIRSFLEKEPRSIYLEDFNETVTIPTDVQIALSFDIYNGVDVDQAAASFQSLHLLPSVTNEHMQFFVQFPGRIIHLVRDRNAERARKWLPLYAPDDTQPETVVVWDRAPREVSPSTTLIVMIQIESAHDLMIETLY